MKIVFATNVINIKRSVSAMNKAFISWDYAKLIKLWKKQKTLDDFTVSSDFLETTKGGA
tara:strand:+ start:443 stop:619 length:177 start_codon:yes stop_codon:yes gene_type:complete